MFKFAFYNKYGNFPRNINELGDIKVNKGALYAACVTVGLGLDINEHKVPIEVVSWKERMIDAFVDDSDTYFKLKNINYLESSEKVTIGFFFGMIFAHAMAQSRYNIRVTAHLTDPKLITYSLKPGKKNYPDLFGIGPKNKGYLIEAKGSSSIKKGSPAKKAKEQLESIDEIEFTSNGNTIAYKYNNLTRIISHIYPKKLNNSKKEEILFMDIIDPEPEKGDKISINADEMSLKYYFKLVDLLIYQKTEIKTLNGQRFILFDVPCHSEKLKLGLLLKIYEIYEPQVKLIKEAIKEKIEQGDEYDLAWTLTFGNNTYETVRETLEPLEFTHLKIDHDPETGFEYSIGPDGVIAMLKPS
ncbi:hypothetical protein [Paenibacillus wenxiniae]|uniref:Uncharacterized protein n=1 Tax=Paenibacillus wenxiniae TaxID=1636843 RepID=A0ABW4RKC0_9BACL